MIANLNINRIKEYLAIPSDASSPIKDLVEGYIENFEPKDNQYYKLVIEIDGLGKFIEHHVKLLPYDRVIRLPDKFIPNSIPQSILQELDRISSRKSIIAFHLLDENGKELDTHIDTIHLVSSHYPAIAHLDREGKPFIDKKALASRLMAHTDRPLLQKMAFKLPLASGKEDWEFNYQKVRQLYDFFQKRNKRLRFQPASVVIAPDATFQQYHTLSEFLECLLPDESDDAITFNCFDIVTAFASILAFHFNIPCVICIANFHAVLAWRSVRRAEGLTSIEQLHEGKDGYYGIDVTYVADGDRNHAACPFEEAVEKGTEFLKNALDKIDNKFADNYQAKNMAEFAATIDLLQEASIESGVGQSIGSSELVLSIDALPQPLLRAITLKSNLPFEIGTTCGLQQPSFISTIVGPNAYAEACYQSLFQAQWHLAKFANQIDFGRALLPIRFWGWLSSEILEDRPMERRRLWRKLTRYTEIRDILQDRELAAESPIGLFISIPLDSAPKDETVTLRQLCNKIKKWLHSLLSDHICSPDLLAVVIYFTCESPRLAQVAAQYIQEADKILPQAVALINYYTALIVSWPESNIQDIEAFIDLARNDDFRNRRKALETAVEDEVIGHQLVELWLRENIYLEKDINPDSRMLDNTHRGDNTSDAVFMGLLRCYVQGQINMRKYLDIIRGNLSARQNDLMKVIVYKNDIHIQNALFDYQIDLLMLRARVGHSYTVPLTLLQEVGLSNPDLWRLIRWQPPDPKHLRDWLSLEPSKRVVLGLCTKQEWETFKNDPIVLECRDI